MSILPLRQDFVGGLAIIGVAAFAFWQGRDLAMGTLGGMGPGMLPKSLAVLLGAPGCAARRERARRSRRPPRAGFRSAAPYSCSARIAAFAVSVRPGGPLVAGPLAIFIAACGSPESRVGRNARLRGR